MHRFFTVLLLLLALLPTTLASQQEASEAGWNDARALELIRRAQARRTEAQADTGLVSYQADARGYVYFYLDRQDTGERTLVKTDQVALEVLWHAPDLSKQRIVGLRDQKTLPARIHYHLDHLSVVQDNFGDTIRLGDGDEVQGVLHPAAPGAETFYQYRLTDSLSISLPGAGEPVRVYELEVRPTDLGRPAFLGSMFVDRRGGDLVRMNFTFTPASYVDRRLDYINISLDNGLWRGRFWLPNQQRVEIRRQLPELDFPAGGVIRGTMRVGNYRFNEPIPLVAFNGPPVVAVPRAQREAFPFEQSIDEELREEGIGPTVELGEIRSRAAELARARVLSGLGAVRLNVPAVSEVIRYNRAEGAVLGLGTTLRPAPGVEVGVRGGWAFGPDHPIAEVEAGTSLGGTRVGAAAYGNLPRDVGVAEPASGLLNSLSALVAGSDYQDLFYTSGVRLGVERPFAPGWTGGATVRAEEHSAAEMEADFSLFGDDFRPVHPIDEGRFYGGEIALERRAPSEVARGWSLRAAVDGGTLLAEDGEDDFGFVQPTLEAASLRRFPWRDAALELRGTAGFSLGDLPRQALFLLGGRGTLPGYEFRAFGGDRFAIGRATASAEILRPWLRGRVLAAAGASGVGEPGERALDLWGARVTDGLRPSVGAGLGLFYDILRVDLVRGFGTGGRWEVIVETQPTFWDFL